jgi:hypothetical protein
MRPPLPPGSNTRRGKSGPSRLITPAIPIPSIYHPGHGYAYPAFLAAAGTRQPLRTAKTAVLDSGHGIGAFCAICRTWVLKAIPAAKETLLRRVELAIAAAGVTIFIMPKGWSMRRLSLCLLLLLLCLGGCASDADKAQWAEVWKDARGDNQKMMADR